MTGMADYEKREKVKNPKSGREECNAKRYEMLDVNGGGLV